MPEIVQHNTDDYPAMIAVPGQPVHVFGYVRYITDAQEAVEFLREKELCRHCWECIEPDSEDGWIHSADGVVGCGLPDGLELYAEPVAD
jgi:hypothetical protein